MPRKTAHPRPLQPLVCVPSFDFPQGNPAEDDDAGIPIKVCYYSGQITLRQGDHMVHIASELAESLFQNIIHHFPEAQQALK